MNKFIQPIMKIVNTLILVTAILIIMLMFYIEFKLSPFPDRGSRSGTLQLHPELLKPIKSNAQFLQILLAIETFIIWLSILLNFLLKHIFQGNWSSPSLLNNRWICLLFTVVIFCLYIYTLLIMLICDSPYC